MRRILCGPLSPLLGLQGVARAPRTTRGPPMTHRWPLCHRMASSLPKAQARHSSGSLHPWTGQTSLRCVLPNTQHGMYSTVQGAVHELICYSSGHRDHLSCTCTLSECAVCILGYLCADPHSSENSSLTCCGCGCCGRRRGYCIGSACGGGFATRS